MRRLVRPAKRRGIPPHDGLDEDLETTYLAGMEKYESEPDASLEDGPIPDLPQWLRVAMRQQGWVPSEEWEACRRMVYRGITPL